MSHRRWLGPVAILVLAACQGGGETSDRVVELKFGHVGAPGSLFAQSAEEFARRVNDRLAGRAKVVVFGSSQLGGDEVLLQKLKLGTVELALPSTIMSSRIDAFGLFEMPYLVEDRDHMRRIEEQIVWPVLAPLAEANGYKIIAVWENGFRHVTNNRRPIATPDDLRGIKLRTPRGRWRVEMFQAYGANPTPMPLAEVFIALQTGVMDGQENPFAQIYSSKFHEVQKYLSLTQHVYTPAFVTAGVNAWEKLPDDLRRVVQQTAQEMQEFVYETALRLDAELLERVREAGVEVNEPDHASFHAMSRPIYDTFARSVPRGKELIDMALALRQQ